MNVKNNKSDNEKIGKVFDSTRIANFSDDIIGVVGWKGFGILLTVLILGFSIFKIFFN